MNESPFSLYNPKTRKSITYGHSQLGSPGSMASKLEAIGAKVGDMVHLVRSNESSGTTLLEAKVLGIKPAGKGQQTYWRS